MRGEVQGENIAEVSMDEARAEIERLLGDGRLHLSERQRELLRYLAERRFSGNREGVKAYCIAIDVLGRTSAFEAGIDPIVRIEMSRLRSALDSYYEAYGATGGIRVQIPRGNYLTRFYRAGPEETPVEPIVGIAESASTEQEASTAIERGRRLPPTGALCAAAAVAGACAAALFAVWRLLADPVWTEKPIVYVKLEAADAGLVQEASLVRESLVSALSRFQTLSIAEPRYSAARAANRVGHTYEIDIRYYDDSGNRSVWWQVVESRSGDVLKSGLENIGANGRGQSLVVQEAADALARRFAPTRSVINDAELRDSPEDAIGNACILRAEYALEVGGPDQIAASRRCLEATLSRNPRISDATAVLSRILLSDSTATADVVAGVELARKATAEAPLSERAQTALMVAQYATGKKVAAIETGNRAISLNPNSPDATAAFALVLYRSGFGAAGVSMAREATGMSDAAPRDALMVLAFDAYARKQYSDASLLAEQINGRDFSVQVLRTAALGELQSPEAAERLEELRALDPLFERSAEERLAVLPLSDELKAGLAKAGARFTSNQLASSENE